VALKKQVSGRITACHKLGKDDQLGSTTHESGVGVNDAPAVSGQVANGRIDLCKAKAHALFEGKGL
jgi:hypothetical protein